MDLSKVSHDPATMTRIAELADGLDRSYSVLFDRVCLVHSRSRAKDLDAYRRNSESDSVALGQ